jgi:hypothetical protein
LSPGPDADPHDERPRGGCRRRQWGGASEAILACAGVDPAVFWVIPTPDAGSGATITGFPAFGAFDFARAARLGMFLLGPDGTDASFAEKE